jgi:predicted transcriptional regulator
MVGFKLAVLKNYDTLTACSVVMKRSTRFVKVPVECICNLTAQELQIWAWMASKPPSYTISVGTLQVQLDKGRTTILRHLADMESKGYIAKTTDQYKGKTKFIYKPITPDK